jgi:hypothetical protein
MRYKGFTEPEEAEKDWYLKWKKISDDETEKAKKAFKQKLPYKFKDKIWRDVKKYLFKYFDEKCAYCESNLLHVGSGDVEHHRPKSEVAEDTKHPGYYWLAYDLKNLLPSCENCNRVRGKMNRFPITGSARAYDPNDLTEVEEPLLLNPYFDEDIDQHLEFVPLDLENGKFVGTVAGISERGRETVIICDLQRARLIERRKTEQETYKLRFTAGLMAGDLESVAEDVISGKAEYSSALSVVGPSVIRMIEKTLKPKTSKANTKVKPKSTRVVKKTKSKTTK